MKKKAKRKITVIPKTNPEAPKLHIPEKYSVYDIAMAALFLKASLMPDEFHYWLKCMKGGKDFVKFSQKQSLYKILNCGKGPRRMKDAHDDKWQIFFDRRLKNADGKLLYSWNDLVKKYRKGSITHIPEKADKEHVADLYRVKRACGQCERCIRAVAGIPKATDLDVFVGVLQQAPNADKT